MKSHNHGHYFWRRAVNVVLCVVLLSANMMAVSAAEELMRDEPSLKKKARVRRVSLRVLMPRRSC